MPGSMLKAIARKLIFENSPRLIVISLVYVVLITIVSSLAFRLPGSISVEDINSRLLAGEMPNIGIIYTNFRPIGVFLALLLLLFQPLLDVGFISYCMKITRSQDTEFKDIFNGFLFFVKVLSIFLLTTLFIALWSFLFIIPGIVASYRYRFAYYILIDDPKKSALQCITESKLVMNGKKLDLFTIDISFIGWYILDLVVVLVIPFPFTVPIVSIWLSPYLGLTRAGFYEDRIVSVAV